MSIIQCFKKHKTEHSVGRLESVYVLRIHGGGYLVKSIHWTELVTHSVTEFMDFFENWTMEKILKKLVALNRYELFLATTANVSYNNDSYKRLLDESG